MRQRPTVQHWIACLEVQVVPPVAVNNFYNLLRVGPVHVLPADTEFPASFAQLDLFARFFDGIGVWDFEVQTLWVDAPGKVSEVALLACGIFASKARHIDFPGSRPSLTGKNGYFWCFCIMRQDDNKKSR